MTEATTPAVTVIKLEVRNGQSDKRPGTIGRRSWDICDEITAREGRTASASEVLAQATVEGINLGQMRAAYAQWRKFHGLQGMRVDDPNKAAAKAEKEAEKAAAAAAKEAEKAAKAEAKAAEKAAKDAAKAAAAEAKAAEKLAAAEAKASAKAAAAAQAEQPAPEGEPAQPE